MPPKLRAPKLYKYTRFLLSFAPKKKLFASSKKNLAPNFFKIIILKQFARISFKFVNPKWD